MTLNPIDPEQAAFSRSNAKTPDFKELRGDAPVDLVCALDALALAEDLTRHAYMLVVLKKHVAKELHKHNVVGSALRDNPLLSASDRSRSE